MFDNIKKKLKQETRKERKARLELEINSNHIDDLKTRLLVVANRVPVRSMSKNIYGVIGGVRENKKTTRREYRKQQDKAMGYNGK